MLAAFDCNTSGSTESGGRRHPLRRPQSLASLHCVCAGAAHPLGVLLTASTPNATCDPKNTCDPPGRAPDAAPTRRGAAGHSSRLVCSEQLPPASDAGRGGQQKTQRVRRPRCRQAPNRPTKKNRCERTTPNPPQSPTRSSSANRPQPPHSPRCARSVPATPVSAASAPPQTECKPAD